MSDAPPQQQPEEVTSSPVPKPQGKPLGDILLDLPTIHLLMTTKPKKDVYADLRGKLRDRCFQACIDYIRYCREEALSDVLREPGAEFNEYQRAYASGMAEGLSRIEVGLIQVAAGEELASDV